MTSGGTDLVTTAPAPTIERSPIATPLRIKDDVTSALNPVALLLAADIQTK